MTKAVDLGPGPGGAGKCWELSLSAAVGPLGWRCHPSGSRVLVHLSGWRRHPLGRFLSCRCGLLGPGDYARLCACVRAWCLCVRVACTGSLYWHLLLAAVNAVIMSSFAGRKNY